MTMDSRPKYITKITEEEREEFERELEVLRMERRGANAAVIQIVKELEAGTTVFIPRHEVTPSKNSVPFSRNTLSHKRTSRTPGEKTYSVSITPEYDYIIKRIT